MADAQARRAAIKRASSHVNSGGTFFRRASATTGTHRTANAPAPGPSKKHS
jgi:hypothetical protein